MPKTPIPPLNLGNSISFVTLWSNSGKIFFHVEVLSATSVSTTEINTAAKIIFIGIAD